MCIYFIAALALFFIAKHSCIKIAAFDYKRLQSWSKEVWPWLCRGKDVFGGAFVIVVFVAICWMFGWNSNVFTVSGCVLELAGMAQAIISLFDLRKYFNHPRLAHICKKWIKDRPKFDRSSCTYTCSGNVSSGVNVNGSVFMTIRKIDANKPINETIEDISINTNTFVDLAIKNLLEHYSFDAKINEVKENIKNEVNAIKLYQKKELEYLHLDDFTSTLVGFAWIAAGTIMSAIGSLLP
jgi:hypothetical protein